MTLKIPHAGIGITTDGNSLTTKATEAVLEHVFYYCVLVYTNKARKPEEEPYEGCKAIMGTQGMPPEGFLNAEECPNLEKARETLEKVLGMEEVLYPYDHFVSHLGDLAPSN